MKKENFRKWAVIWKRDKNVLVLYGMKETSICVVEWKDTIGDRGIFESCMIFEKRIDAEKWRAKNTDWETVLIEIKIISQ